jgi:hypothetical protein
MEIAIKHFGQVMAPSAVELWEYLMKILQNVAVDKDSSRSTHFVGLLSTTNVHKYAVMEIFIQRSKESLLVAVKNHTTQQRKFVATKYLNKNTSAWKKGIAGGSIT